MAIINASRDSDTAAPEVLGMSYAALGAAVAETLNLPTKLALSLTRVPGPSAHESMTDAEKLACAATLANNITVALAAPTTARDKREAIKNLVRSYGSRFTAIEGQLDALISNAVSELGRHSRMFQLDRSSRRFIALGVGRTRTIVLLKDGSMPVARFRFGLGPSPTDMRAWSAVPLTGSDDLFSIAIHQQKDLVIRDTSAREAAALLPEWYQRTLSAPRCIVLLPLVVDHKALGLLCVEGDQARANLLTPALINYLKVLRGQAVIAIHHRAARPAGHRP